jgi:hypothetical protein
MLPRPLLALGLAVLAAAPAARADRRSFVRAYEYATQPAGNLEVEIWNDLTIPKSSSAATLIEPKVELEVGLTDNWDLALYHAFASQVQDGQSTFRFDSWRAETRYRLFERGVLPVDVMLYLEVERPADFRDPAEVEEKVILGKDLGRLGLVVNLVAEQKLGSGSRSGHVFELDAGARWEVMPALRLGAEYWVTSETAADGSVDTRHYLGPSISVANSKIWMQLGAGVGIGDNDQLFVRSVIGFNL